MKKIKFELLRDGKPKKEEKREIEWLEFPRPRESTISNIWKKKEIKTIRD